MTRRKILIFTVPFSGHLDVLRNLIINYQAYFDFKIIITGWKNIEANLDRVNVSTTILAKKDLHQTDPALWTLPRVYDLLDNCLAIAQEFKPDIILYDFFSLEGNLVGKILNIPYWCSIPAMIGPFENYQYRDRKLAYRDNQTSLELISQKFGITINRDEIELISDGFHLPGQVNLLWSYQSLVPANFRKNRQDAPYVFVGNVNEAKIDTKIKSKNEQFRIYFSLGTVILNNLWNQQEHTKQQLRKFIKSLTQLWQDPQLQITFVTQGKNLVDHYPNNWRVLDRSDQLQELSQTDLFITHGGSNSFHEAVLAKVPMIVIPFFGDQLLVGQQVQNLGLGINLAQDANIDTAKSKTFLDQQLIARLQRAVNYIIENKREFDHHLDSVSLDKHSIFQLLDGKIDFGEGDLLCGRNVIRKQYIEATNSQSEFRIMEFKPFCELAAHDKALPRLVDIYHDVILDKDFLVRDLSSNLSPYIDTLKDYCDYLAGETDLCRMCLKGLDFFSKKFKIHFILDGAISQQNYITYQEVKHILAHRDRFIDSVIFYQKLAGSWIPIEFDRANQFLVDDDYSSSDLKSPSVIPN